MLPQQPDPAAVYKRVRVVGACYNARNPGLYDCVDTGRLFPIVAAGLQSHIQGGAGRILGTVLKRPSFRVSHPVPFVPSGSDDFSIFYNDSPYHGIRGRKADPFLCKL